MYGTQTIYAFPNKATARKWADKRGIKITRTYTATKLQVQPPYPEDVKPRPPQRPSRRLSRRS